MADSPQTAASPVPAPSPAPSAALAAGGADRTSVLVAGARTPMGRLLGGLKDFPAAQLGAVAIRGALDKAGLDPPPCST